MQEAPWSPQTVPYPLRDVFRVLAHKGDSLWIRHCRTYLFKPESLHITHVYWYATRPELIHKYHLRALPYRTSHLQAESLSNVNQTRGSFVSSWLNKNRNCHS